MQTVVAHDGLLSLGLKLLGLKPIDVDNMHVTTISAFASTQLATRCLVAQGPVCIVEFPDLAQRLASRLMKRFWQTFDHVAGLMVRRTTLLKASAPSTMNSRQTSEIEPALDEMVDQRLHYGGVQLGCPPR